MSHQFVTDHKEIYRRKFSTPPEFPGGSLSSSTVYSPSSVYSHDEWRPTRFTLACKFSRGGEGWQRGAREWAFIQPIDLVKLYVFYMSHYNSDHRKIYSEVLFQTQFGFRMVRLITFRSSALDILSP